MSEYVRPAFPREVFYDSAGAVIEYGNRWRGGMPPEDTYSVDSNTQRFAPLHLVADALIDYLVRSYAVLVEEDLAFAADLMTRHNDVLRAVRVIPANPDAAPLTFVYTSYPGVILHAGLLHDFPVPQCGCDACDETAESGAGELEQTVEDVVSGGYSEWVDPVAWLSVGHALVSTDGTRRRSGSSWPGNPPRSGLREAAERLGRFGGAWQPWGRLDG